jgi:2-dehydro-3-deoxyglucarate aldolase/4-hydroxy-2-oxoheptanedioate aldolase
MRFTPAKETRMDLPVNHFKRAIASGKTPIGCWLASGAPSTAEALGSAGYDFLVVDTEHTPIDTAQMTDILRTIAGTPAQAIVRPPWNDMVMVKRVLDAGAQSLLLPFVQNAEEAKRAVAHTRYPPDGVRGVAGTHRGSRYGTIPNYFKRAHEEICVIVQIETLAAFAQLEAIASVPGVDSIFIGPSDLSASMGLLGDIGNASVQEKLSAAAQTCKRLGKPCGIIGFNPEMAKKFLGYGYSWIAVGSDLALMVSRAQEYLAAMRA